MYHNRVLRGIFSRKCCFDVAVCRSRALYTVHSLILSRHVVVRAQVLARHEGAETLLDVMDKGLADEVRCGGGCVLGVVDLVECMSGRRVPARCFVHGTGRGVGWRFEALDLLRCHAAMSQERRAPKHLHAVAQAVVALRWLLLG